ncbi:MAG: hypothetical protein ABSB15_10265 [Bryobacteraceae bacterium]|jgi:chromosome segregation ATPase
MGTNGTNIAAELRAEEEEIYGEQTGDHGQPLPPWDRTHVRKRSAENGAPEAETADDFALASLVDKIAYGLARGLVVAMRELELHIASETRKVGDTVERRLDKHHIDLQELSGFIGEQRSTNLAVQDQLQQLAAAGAGLREADAHRTAELESLRTEARELSASVSRCIDISTASLQESHNRHGVELEDLRKETRAFSSSVSERIDASVAALQETGARHAADLAALRDETRASAQSVSERVDSLCGDLGVQQEDIAAGKGTLCTLGARVDALVERLDRQADAVRSLHTNYSQRETELEQLVSGLARLRAFPAPLPTNGL